MKNSLFDLNRLVRLISISTILLLVQACNQVDNEQQLLSPSGNIQASIYLTDQGQPAYKVYYKGALVVDESKLGFELDGLDSLRSGFSWVSHRRSKFDEVWEQPWGEQRLIRNNYNELKVELKEIAGSKRRLNLVFRVFDDGVGFRYEFPEQEELANFKIQNELTEFKFLENYTTWWTPAHAGNQYEYLYRETSLSDVELAHTPITLKSASGPVVVLHEAALFDYSTMNLVKTSQFGLEAHLVPFSKTEDFKAEIKAPFHTPWRTIQIADSENDLITSYISLNLNEPNKLGDVSWVKPGKYVGIWWELHLEKGTWNQGEKHAATTENTKKYIDFAAKHGFNGVLVEGWNYGWDGEWWNHGGGVFNFTKPYPDYDVEALSEYAKSKGVFIIGHHETGAATDNYDRQLEDAYQFLEDHGMKAVKTGYVESGELLTNGKYHHGQHFVRHAEKVTKTAAKHKVMVVAHETVKDTGERRTYPNLVAREVARGQEYNAWSDDGGNPPNHTTVIPYTRLLSGPMDFTPGAFELTLPDKPKNQVNTTLAKQLALYVVVYSPVQMACDLPENYEAHPDALQFIKDVAVDWETTQVIDGKIGEFVAIARQERQGEDWYLGALTNEKARELKLPLSFLKDDKEYEATIYRDADDAHYQTNPGAYVIETKKVKNSEELSVSLAAGGGVAISLKAL